MFHGLAELQLSLCPLQSFLDIDKTVCNFFDGLRDVHDAQSADTEMSSDSLAFIFTNEYGSSTH
jgi:hypothetical protein